MAYVLRTKDNPGDVGRAADQQQSVDNEAALYAAILGPGPVATGGEVRQFVKKTGMVDNTVTEVFTVTTVNEAGDNDGGVWGLVMHGIATHGVGPTGDTACMQFYMSADHAINAAAAAANTVIAQTPMGVTYSVAARKSINIITWSVAETSKYIISVRCQIDLTGDTVTTGAVYGMVELVYAGHTTPPVITSAG